MPDENALRSLFDGHFQRLEPVVFLADGVFVKSERFDDGVSFVTALGVPHALRRLCSRRALDEQFVRCNAGTVARQIHLRLALTRIDVCRDDLRYFVDGLLPAFHGRDWSEEFEVDADAAMETPRPPGTLGTEDEIDALSRELPVPVLPSPSLLALGLFRLLGPSRPADPDCSDQVRRGCETLVPTDHSVSVEQVNQHWHEAVGAFVGQTVARLVDAGGDAGSSPAVAAAREEVGRTGCLERGDLLFLPGQPPRVGHIVPTHFNRVLGRPSERDLAMVVPLTRPPRILTPQVFARDGRGRWSHFHLPHGLCLGDGPHGLRPQDPGLALLAYLRWASIRISANGAFHVNDNRPTEYES